MKKIITIFLISIMIITITSCDGELTLPSGITLPTEIQTTENRSISTEQTTEVTTNDVLTEIDLTLQLTYIYNLAVEAQAFEGTYEEWLETIRGPQGIPGEAGESVVLALNGDYIQWKGETDETWNDLIAISNLKGDQGESGLGIESTAIDNQGNLIITYSDKTEINLGQVVTVYQVNYHDYNGYLLDTVIVEYNGTADTLASPSREGYDFIGWSMTELTNITSNIDVYAQYEIRTFTISFNSTGGNDIDSIENVEYGSTLVLPIPEKQGYIFLGWFKGYSVNAPQFYNNDEIVLNLTLYARWEEASVDQSNNLYEVKFYDANTEIIDKVIVQHGTTVELPIPEKDGYIFTGWYRGYSINASQFYNSDLVVGNMNLFARWMVDENVNQTDQTELTLTTLYNSDEEYAGSVYCENSEEHPYRSFDIAYKILSVENGVIQQLSSWVSSQASEIVVSTEEVTEHTFTKGLEVSLSTTIEMSTVLTSVSVELGITASIESSVSKAQSVGQSLTFPLDEYDEGLDYAVFLTGNYDVYQIFSYNYETGQMLSSILVKMVGDPVVTVLSSPNSQIDNVINIEDHEIEFDEEMYFAGGDGSLNNPYEIYNEDGLFGMMFKPFSCYKLMNDIDLVKFQGTNGTFYGTLDGNDKVISGLRIVIPDGKKDIDEFYGFFGKLNGTIKNITFEDCHISQINNFYDEGDGFVSAGIVAGFSDEDANIINVQVKNSLVFLYRTKAYAGGIVGSARGTTGEVKVGGTRYSTISNCHVWNTKVSGFYMEGGIIGYGITVDISDCTFEGIIRSDGSQGYGRINHLSIRNGGFAGGIAGYIYDSIVDNNSVKNVKLYNYQYGDVISDVNEIFGVTNQSIDTNNTHELVEIIDIKNR